MKISFTNLKALKSKWEELLKKSCRRMRRKAVTARGLRRLSLTQFMVRTLLTPTLSHNLPIKDKNWDLLRWCMSRMMQYNREESRESVDVSLFWTSFFLLDRLGYHIFSIIKVSFLQLYKEVNYSIKRLKLILNKIKTIKMEIIF